MPHFNPTAIFTFREERTISRAASLPVTLTTPCIPLPLHAPATTLTQAFLPGTRPSFTLTSPSFPPGPSTIAESDQNHLLWQTSLFRASLAPLSHPFECGHHHEPKALSLPLTAGTHDYFIRYLVRRLHIHELCFSAYHAARKHVAEQHAKQHHSGPAISAATVLTHQPSTYG